MQYLKADTTKIVRIGPAVVIGDGYTATAALDISTADYAYMLHGDSVEVDISANTWAAVTSVTGMYDLTLTGAQLTTEGPMSISIYDVSLCLPIKQDFHVLNANVYDALFAAATTDYLQIDQIQLGGDAQSATDLKDFADAGYDPATNKVQGVVLVDTTTANTDMVAEAPTAAAVVNEWESQSQADPTGFHVNVIESAGTAQTANDNGADINTLLSRVTAAVATAAGLADVPTVAEFEARTLLSASYFDPAADTVATVAELTAMAGTIGTLDALNTSISNLIAALNDLSAADVNAQMLDVLNVDTFGEPSAVPAATASLVVKLGWLAALARNKITQTGTTQTLRNDADAADIGTATVSDDGTTTTRAEWV